MKYFVVNVGFYFGFDSAALSRSNLSGPSKAANLAVLH